MRRVLRIFANVAAVMSLLLCLAAVCLWVRSYWKTEALSRAGYSAGSNRFRQLILASDRGLLGSLYFRIKFNPGAVTGVTETALERKLALSDGGAISYQKKWVAFREQIPRPE